MQQTLTDYAQWDIAAQPRTATELDTATRLGLPQPSPHQAGNTT